jgi:hypothetical protein
MNKSFRDMCESSGNSKKTFVQYAVEVLDNIIKDKNIEANQEFWDDADNIKGAQRALVTIMGAIANDEKSPNYQNLKHLFPGNYDKKLFDNGEENTYDSEWFLLKDAGRFTVTRQALTAWAKENNVTIDVNKGFK